MVGKRERAAYIVESRKWREGAERDQVNVQPQEHPSVLYDPV